ncbi:uncharacterized protein P884DRAFT_7988 [Thermothelomyces heterothallicus CBS 202.75]|uniref:uncharacterized protein n=1 Tax=Thermothelomyces heterothallicus CBS 202.75 TaxID=1149848 RepID=UPI003743F3A9
MGYGAMKEDDDAFEGEDGTGWGRTTRCRRKRAMVIPPGSASLCSAGVLLLSCFSVSFSFFLPSFFFPSLLPFPSKGWRHLGGLQRPFPSICVEQAHSVLSPPPALFFSGCAARSESGCHSLFRFVLRALDCSTRLDRGAHDDGSSWPDNTYPRTDKLGTLSLHFSFVYGVFAVAVSVWNLFCT